MKYTSFDFDLSRFNLDDDYSYVRLPYESHGDKKVLFILDAVPSEDLHSGRLMSGVTGDLIKSLVGYSAKLAKSSPRFSWLACSFNMFRTYGKSDEFRQQAEEAFKDRIEALIVRYKPDYVVTFGTSVQRALLKHKLTKDAKGRTRYSYWIGVPVECTIRVGKGSHTTKVVSNLSLNDILRGSASEASLLGYAARSLMPIFGKFYGVDSEHLENHKSIVIDSYKKFQKLMTHVREKPAVAIDTEARSLYKVTNKLLTVQFAYDTDKGFLLPMHHKDTPFTPKELKLITEELKAFFEGENDNKYHIYTNAKFDLTLLRASCGIEYFKNSVWDILGGAFAIDENMRFLDTILGEYYYSLANLSVQHGFEGYLTADFGKQHRANFESADLTDAATIKYTTMDVVVPFAIHEVQKRMAKDFGYEKYEKVVTNEISDTIHSFSTMEYCGAGLDVNYLFYLRTDQSPIEKEVQNMQNALLHTKAAKKANKLLANKSGIPTKSLWGSDYEAASVFKLNKPAHRKLLFFDVLGLKPLAVGKNGEGKLDKDFQKHYADVPEVAQYTALEKAKKLKNAYVKSFINMLAENADLQHDHRIRPNYGYLTVVTHRTSARDPNLQQVPAHSALGKHIKRLFVAREGTLYIKVDYRVHEVRGWGLIAFDKAVAAVFAAAKKIRDEYRLHPSKDLAKRIKYEADVHIQNASYFFNVALEAVDKPLRNAVKGIIFGLIYGMGLKTLAGNIKQELEFTQELVANFAKRFPKAMAWTKNIKKFAAKHFYVEAPNGIRRNLFGYLIPESHEDRGSITSRMDRQAGNAPIQGMCSKFMMNGIRILDQNIFKIRKKRKSFVLHITNSVHDSLENESGYENFIKSLALIEWSLTEGVKRLMKQRYNFDLVSDLEIDFEIGATLSTCESWDFSVHQLERLVMDALLFQRNQLRRAIDVDKVHDVVFRKEALEDDAPEWMKQQIKNLGYKFNLTEKSYIREIFESGRSKVVAAEKILDTAKDGSDEFKSAKSALAEGTDLVNYAKELNDMRENAKLKRAA